MKSSKLVFRTYSIYPLFKAFLIRIAAIVFCIACFYNYKENPLVTSIGGTIFFFAFLIIGDDELVVYSDKLRFSSNSIMSMFTQKGIYYFENIKAFSVSGDFGQKMDILSDNAPVKIMDPFNVISITLSNGKVIEIHNHVYIEKLTKASKIINSKIQNQSKREDLFTLNGR